MAEYRLDELAGLSGVNARNIRAYRERGLLAAPRREGRSAYYNDGHLAQLEAIDRLLRRGFNSVHIAEFFAAVRAGQDLADMLGLTPALLDPGPQGSGQQDFGRQSGATAASQPLNIDPAGDEARRLLEYGLAQKVADGIALTDAKMGDIVLRSPTGQLAYLRVILQVFEAVRGPLEELALPRGKVARVVNDYRDLVTSAVARCLDEVLPQRVRAAGQSS